MTAAARTAPRQLKAKVIPNQSYRRSPINRGALALVERNEAPLGIVYCSDAVASKGVKVVATFPEDSHKKVEYPVAVVEGHNNATVKAFYDYLKGPQACVHWQN